MRSEKPGGQVVHRGCKSSALVRLRLLGNEDLIDPRDLGLVTQLARPDALRGEVDELVRRILAMDAEAVRQCKAYFQAAHGGALDDNFARATDLLTARTVQLLARRG